MEAEAAESYSIRAMDTLERLASGGNPQVDLSAALEGLMEMTRSGPPEMQMSAGRVLSSLSSPQAQRALVQMALADSNLSEVRLAAFASLAESAKRNGNLLLSEQVESLYQLVQSRQADAVLREAAAGAFGALNLPSQRVKDLILEQARS